MPSVVISGAVAIGVGEWDGWDQTEDGMASVQWEKSTPVPRAEPPVRELSGCPVRKI